MGAMRRCRTLAPLVVATALVGIAPAASADDANGVGFGKRGRFVVTLDNVLTVASLEMTGDDSSKSTKLESKGMFPLYMGGGVGFHGIAESGLTYGSSVWFARVKGEGDATTFVQLRPRIGYATSKDALLGLWVRGGPNWFHYQSGDDDSGNSISLGVDAFGVITPVPHFGIYLGPSLDFALWGKDHDGNTFKQSGYSFGLGLLADF